MKTIRAAEHEVAVLESIRRAAQAVDFGLPRHYWIGMLAGAACLTYALVLTALPGQMGETAMRLDDVRGALDQARRLSAGRISADGIYPLGYPFSLLLLTQIFQDVAAAARAISGIAGILALYLAYLIAGVLADEHEVDEHALFTLVALSLSPAFFLASVSGGVEMPHLVLMLGALLAVLRALHTPTTLAPMALAGVLAGLGMMLRPSSLLALGAVALWLSLCRPFTSEQGWPNIRAGLGFLAGFLIGAAPQMLLSLAQGADASVYFATTAALLSRAVHEPVSLALGVKDALIGYVAADDLERLDAVTGSTRSGVLGLVAGGAVSLAPSMLKLLGIVGLLLLSWVERFDSSLERVRLPAILVVLYAVAGSLGLVDERNPVLLLTLLTILAFAVLPALAPGAVSGLAGLAIVGFLVLHQVGAGYPARLAASYAAADEVAVALHAAGAAPGEVVSASWSFYDTRSPWRERFRGLPAYVDSPRELVRELQRSGARYFVFDQVVGAKGWPGLADLLDTSRPQSGLRVLGPVLRNGQGNDVVIYKLE